MYLCLLLHDTQHAFRLLYLCWLCFIFPTCIQTAVSMLTLLHDTQHAFKLLYLCWISCMIHNMHSKWCIYADSAAWYTKYIQTAVSLLTAAWHITCIQLLYLCWLCFMIHNMHSNCCIYAVSAAWYTTCIQTAVSDSWYTTCIETAVSLLTAAW